MKRITRLLLTLPVVLLPFACQDVDPVVPDAVGGPLSVVFQVTGFHFLPPVGKGSSAAGFLGTLSPVVVVCQWQSAQNACAAGTTLAQFSRTEGTGDATIQLIPDNSYQVDWNTTFTEHAVTSGAVYQVVALLGGAVLGTADITLHEKLGQSRHVSGDVFALLKGRTLPIKFGIELSAVLSIVGADAGDVASSDFIVQTFSTEAGTQKATVPSGDAAFQVNGGDVQLPSGFGGTEFTVVIFEKTLDENGECEASYGGPNTGGCYVFETIPQGVTFLNHAGEPAGISGVCPAANVSEEYLLAQFDEGLTTFPTPSPVEVVICDEVGLQRVPRLLRGLAHLVLPASLHAADFGQSGLIRSFSTFFWAVPLAVESDPASPLPAGPFAAGQTISLSFRVVSTHSGDEIPVREPVSNVALDFSVSSGTLSSASAVSNDNGVVSVNWTLPVVVGSHVLTASVAGTAATAESSLQVGAVVGTTFIANFDVGPSGAPIAAGSIVNNTYAAVGITLTKLPAGSATCGSGNQVFANSHGPAPWFTGEFVFASGQNNVSACSAAAASDFNENDFGVIQASFAQAVPQVCIDVAPTTEGGSGFLAAYDVSGALLQRVTSAGGVRERLCVTAVGIRSVRFAGDGNDFAIFDNLELIFATLPPPIG